MEKLLKRFEKYNPDTEEISSTNWLHDKLTEIYNNNGENAPAMIDHMCAEMFEHGRMVICQLQATGKAQELETSLREKIKELGFEPRIMHGVPVKPQNQ